MRKTIGETALWIVLAAFWVIPATAQDNSAKQDKSSQAALRMYADAANFQNNGAYELAAEEWARFVSSFGNDPLATKARHYLGVCNLQIKQFDQAAKAFEQVIADSPKFELIEETYFNLGLSQFRLAERGDQQQYAKAAETFSALAKNHPQGKDVDQALFYQGESLFLMGKLNEAILPYGLIVRDYRDSKWRCEALYALGVTYEGLDQFPNAGKAYDLFLAECAEHQRLTEVRMRKAETVLRAGDFLTAEKQFADVAAVADFEFVDHAMYRQAYCAFKQERFVDAGQLYARVPTRFPESQYVAEAAMSAGQCFYRAQQFDDAAAWFGKVVSDGGAGSTQAAHWLCRIHLRNGQPQQAMDVASAVVPAGEGEYLPHLKMDLADALYELPNRRPDALDHYLRIAAEHRGHELAEQALYNAAFAAMDLKRYADAVSIGTQATEGGAAGSFHADTRYVIAESLLQLKQFPEAEAVFRDLVSKFANHADVGKWQIRLGLTMYLQKKYPETIALLNGVLPAIQGSESQAEGHYLIGASKFYVDEFTAAARSLRASVLADPKWRQADEALLYLSRAQRKQGELDEAMSSVMMLIENFPNSLVLDQAHYRLGEYHYAAERYAEAIRAYDRVLTDWTQSTFVPYAEWGKGWGLIKTGRYQEASDCFTTVIERFPDTPVLGDALFARGLSRRQTGQYADSLADLNAFLKTNPSPDQAASALYERGLAETAKKDHAAARSTLTELFQNYPEFASRDLVLYELAWTAREMDDEASAANYFGQLVQQFPNSSMAAEASFHVGEDQYNKKDYTAAAASYAKAQAGAPTDDLSERADYKLGWSYFQLADYREALTAFDRQVLTHPKGNLYVDGLFMKAECLFKTDQFAQASPIYTTLRGLEPPTEEIGVLVLLHGGQAASQLKDYSTAIGFLEQIPSKHGDSEHAVAEAYYELGWAKQKMSRPDDAVADYAQAASLGRQSAVGARAQFMIGEVEFERKRYDEAVKQFQRVMYRYGEDNISADIKKWQARAGYEAGRCSEVQIRTAPATDRARLIEEARKFYTYVVERHPDSDLIGQARQRLDVLARL